MILSEKVTAPAALFSDIMAYTDEILNADAALREDYYVSRGGKALEKDVYAAVCRAAQGTEFENTVKLISGATFPDIVADGLYGVEVKSTEKNHWTSVGSSILESTRSASVEKIYLTFGKLGKPVQFMSRPYEECLSDIAVTHYPRYRIDMRLKKGETIFDEMGITYDELRQKDNPVAPVSKYYKSKLKPGESLWWASDDGESASPPTVKLWTSLSAEEKERLTVCGYALFPEILSPASGKKYNRYALWLATVQGIVNTNVRDSFSAGGRVDMLTAGGLTVKMPAAFGRIKKYSGLIKSVIEETEESVLCGYWQTEVEKDRMRQWCTLVAHTAERTVGYDMALSVLSQIFLQ
ncbi:MAG: hypothetical protein LUD19_02785 [Clostridia bacterium]|nr:hypothetical protein [Clostridia bacterium]